MAFFKTKDRDPKNITNVGIKDGVAGKWTSPNYLKYNTVAYKPGTQQYFGSVSSKLNKSLADYKKLLKS